MSEKDVANSESSLVVIKLDDTPQKATKSPMLKRHTRSSPVTSSNSKRRRIRNEGGNRSSLRHLEKTKARNTRSISLDDSIVVLKEVISSPALNNSTSLGGGKRKPVCPDDSIIILSDNEGESKTESTFKQTNLETVREDDSAGGDSELEEIAAVREVIKSGPIRAGSSIPPQKKCSISNAVVELQSISIDSEDENTIPNDDASKSNSQAEVITVDPYLNTKTDGTVCLSTVSNSADCENTKNDESGNQVRLHSKESFNRGAEKDDDSAHRRLIKKAKQLGKDNSKRQKFRAFRIDTKGDPSNFHRLNARSSEIRETKKPSSQNPNWAEFVRNTPGAETNMEQHNLAHKNEVDRIRSTRTEETVVQNKSSARPCTNESTLSTNEPEVSGIESCQTEEVIAENQSSRILSTKQTTLSKNKPEANMIGSYYTEETVAKSPGSLRVIVIDGCNIAMAYTNCQSFSEVGIKLVIDYFHLRGHTVKVFVPQHKRGMQRPMLEKLHTQGIVVFTPSRTIGGKKIISYDDRYILDYAAMCDGIVVSRDQYRDLYNKKPEWKNIIENRLLVPTFVGKCVMFPDDPLGRYGPTLEEFLRH